MITTYVKEIVRKIDVKNDVFDAGNDVSDVENIVFDIEKHIFDVENIVFDIENFVCVPERPFWAPKRAKKISNHKDLVRFLNRCLALSKTEIRGTTHGRDVNP